LPEARLNLAQAVIHISLAPKSNAVAAAIGEAAADVRAGLAGPVPVHLRDASYPSAARLGHGKGYLYPHDDPAGVVQQQYAPDSITGKRYYVPTSHGAEARVTERSDRIRAILQGRTAEPDNGGQPERAGQPGDAGQPDSAGQQGGGEPGGGDAAASPAGQ
jgi:putative ATPase